MFRWEYLEIFRKAVLYIVFGQLYLLYPFHSAASFYSRWKHQKTRGFLMFSGGIERELVAWNGWTYLCICLSNPTRSSWLRLITQFLSLQKTRICKTIFLNKSFDSSEFCFIFRSSHRCSLKKLFLNFLQNSQENTSAGVNFK